MLESPVVEVKHLDRCMNDTPLKVCVILTGIASVASFSGGIYYSFTSLEYNDASIWFSSFIGLGASIISASLCDYVMNMNDDNFHSCEYNLHYIQTSDNQYYPL